jgi:hypothetical protein
MLGEVYRARSKLKPGVIHHLALLFLTVLEQHADKVDFINQGGFFHAIKVEYLRDAFGSELDKHCRFKPDSMFLLLDPRDINLPLSFLRAWRRLMEHGLANDMREYRPSMDWLSPLQATWPRAQDMLDRIELSDAPLSKTPVDRAVHELAVTIFQFPASIRFSQMHPSVLDLFRSAIEEAQESPTSLEFGNRTTAIKRQQEASERREIGNADDSDTILHHRRDATTTRYHGKLPQPFSETPTIANSVEATGSSRASRKRTFSARSPGEDSNSDDAPVPPPRRRLLAKLPIRSVEGPPNGRHSPPPEQSQLSVPVSAVLRRMSRMLERYGHDRDELIASIGRYRIELEELEQRRRTGRSPT